MASPLYDFLSCLVFLLCCVVIIIMLSELMGDDPQDRGNVDEFRIGEGYIVAS